MSTEKVRLAMLISGGGSTMQAIGESCCNGALRGLVQPVVVISSREKVNGIKKAQALRIPVEVVPRKEYPTGTAGVEAYGEALQRVLSAYHPDVVTLNGFLSQISEAVISVYEDRIFNQHPGPVPEFGGQGMYGRRVHAAVILYNQMVQKLDPYTEVIAQRVHRNYDEGAVVKSARVAIDPGETVEVLQQRAVPVEHQVQIELLKDVANGAVREVTDRTPYASPRDYAILEQARAAAQSLYPRG